MAKRKAVLIFGVGTLQQSIIKRAKQMGLFTVGIDPLEDAACREEVDAYEVVGGQDFEGTCVVIEKYGIDAIVTAATDKPLVMMARVAKRYGFPFYSVETAQWSTDKFQMKQRFLEGGIPCAKGRLVKSANEVDDFEFPVIVKPRDNSGSRGVKLCKTRDELENAIAEALSYSHLKTVLVEEFIEGKEYSIESLHHDGKHEVIQFTEKRTTTLPYNVELGHKQPARLTEKQKGIIQELILRIAHCMHFANCPSHTELKINKKGIFIIETSPRLGGDYITSTLVPLSTGINMEDLLLKMALGEKVDTQSGRVDLASGVSFLCFPEGVVKHIDPKIYELTSSTNVKKFALKLREGDEVHQITSSLNRYGEVIIKGKDREEVDDELNKIMLSIEKGIIISK